MTWHIQPVNPLSATVPISLVNGVLARADPAAVQRLAGQSGIPYELLHEPGSRVTQEQFSTLYRLLASELDDEMPGIFSRPLRNGTLKYLCLSLLDAPRLEVAMHRFGQFLHLILEEFRLESRRDGAVCRVELVPNPDGPALNVLGRELMLKLAHGVASWLVGQKIPLLEVEFDFPRPPRASDYLYLFPGPVQFGRERTSMSFDATYLDMTIRRHKADLKRFLARAPEDWIFVSFAEQLVSHRVRQYLAGVPADDPNHRGRRAGSAFFGSNAVSPAVGRGERRSRRSRTSCGAILPSSGSCARPMRSGRSPMTSASTILQRFTAPSGTGPAARLRRIARWRESGRYAEVGALT